MSGDNRTLVADLFALLCAHVVSSPDFATRLSQIACDHDRRMVEAEAEIANLLANYRSWRMPLPESTLKADQLRTQRVTGEIEFAFPLDHYLEDQLNSLFNSGTPLRLSARETDGCGMVAYTLKVLS